MGGVGYFVMERNGITIEVFGTNWIDPVHKSDFFLDKDYVPTRVRLGHLWVKTLPNPGLWLRGEYKQGYLKHAQSYRHIPGMKGAQDDYFKHSIGGWQDCASQRHDCMNRYPTDGNL